MPSMRFGCQLSRTGDLIVVAIVGVAGVWAAAIDLRRRRVPNGLTAGIVVVGTVLAATHATSQSLASAIAGCGVGLLLMLPGHMVGATGAGDVKLLAAFGT